VHGSIPPVARRIAIGIGGSALLVAGVAMIVLPGPAVVVIPAGLGLLALEFEWAARWRDALRVRLGRGPSAPDDTAPGG